MMYRNLSALLVGAVAFINSDTSLAQETQLSEVVVTASRNRSLLDVAQPASVMSGDDLARQLTGSLGETLSGELGVSSTYFGPTASRPVIRGLGGYRVQTLLDGIATLDVGGLSDDHATTVDPALAEQLEVLKGPSTLLYGSGASGGLVNVVTHRIPGRATHHADSAMEGMLEVRAGTVSDERAGAGSLNLSGERFALHVDAFASESDAVDIPGETMSARLREIIVAGGGEPDSVSGQIPNAFSDTAGGALGASWLGDNASIGASFSRYDTRYGIPSEDTAFIDLRQDRVDGKAEWRSDDGWLRGIVLQGALNDYTHTEFEAPGEPGTVFTQDAYEVRATAEHAHGQSWRGNFGMQITELDFVAAGNEAFVPASLTRSVGVFALEEVDVARWTLGIGARWEQQSIDTDIAPRFDDTAGSLGGSAVFKFTDDDSLAINLTHTARHPQATELYANGPHIAAARFEIGDPTLATEKANTVDVSLRRQGDGFTWQITAFYNNYDDFVYAAPTDDVQDGLPVVRYSQDAATLYGVEAELWAPLSDTLRLRVMADATRGERSGDEPLPQMPASRIGAALHFDLATWHAQLDGTYHAEQTRLAANELGTDSYLMVDADVSYRIESQSGDWLLFLRGTNLLDEEARQHTSTLKDLVPMPGRSLVVGMRVTVE